MSDILWNPSKELISKSNMHRYMQYLADEYSTELKDTTFSDYNTLYEWSIQSPQTFWSSLWEFFEIKYSKPWENVLVKPSGMFRARWFEGAKLNFAENLLVYDDEKIALEFHNENGQTESISYHGLYQRVAQFSSVLKTAGIVKGDRVAGLMPNIPQAVIVMLATSSLGAIWSSCSPDFGIQAMLDRFQQINPKALIFSDGYYYNGKSHLRIEVIQQLIDKLSKKNDLQFKLLVPYIKPPEEYKYLPDDIKLFDGFVNTTERPASINFQQLEFSDPLYIMFSSGTTGKPKCIAHGAGGTLLQHLKELSLHVDLKREDKLFYYTSTGWMMWNWMLSALGLGTTLVLYDGSPFYPEVDSLLKLIDQQKVSVFGCGAKYISSLQKNNVDSQSYKLDDLRLILSTGSPLLSESFDYVYQKIKPTVQLSSISGGTDIISCFVLGNPVSPVHRGEIQCSGLGMAVAVFNDQAERLIEEKGELVCLSEFPSMPVFFWNDPGHKKYHQTYFEKYTDVGQAETSTDEICSHVWSHGDYAKITKHKGVVIYGRSDATLNPAGIRIGTAEIYRQLENIKTIIDCLVVGQSWKGDQRVILFVQLKGNEQLEEHLILQIKQNIKENLSVHHVPAKIIQVADIPKTYSGKIAEIAVTRIIHNEPVTNLSALINPQCLEQYKHLESLHHD